MKPCSGWLAPRDSAFPSCYRDESVDEFRIGHSVTNVKSAPVTTKKPKTCAPKKNGQMVEVFKSCRGDQLTIRLLSLRPIPPFKRCVLGYGSVDAMQQARCGID